MTQRTSNHYVFYDHTSSSNDLIVYMDDIVIKDNDHDGIQKLKQHIFNYFQTKDLEKLEYFLGIEIAQSKFDVVISQRNYVFDILEEISMIESKPINTWIQMSSLY